MIEEIDSRPRPSAASWFHRLLERWLPRPTVRYTVHLIDLDGMIKEAGGVERLTVDGIHINEAGHTMLAKVLEKHVLNLAADERG